MRLEVVRIVADWLADGTNGVNALLPGIPLDGGDSTPPVIASIVDETRSGVAARRHFPEDHPTPALFVFTGRDARLMGEVHTHLRDAEISVTIGYVQKAATTENGLRDAFYTMRAVERSLKKLQEQANEASRTRNNIAIIAAREFVYPNVFAEVGGLVMTAGVEAVYELVRDYAP